MATGRIEAQPERLGAGAGRARQLGTELSGFRSRLASVSGLAAAAGAPGAQGAIADSCGAWGSAIEALEAQAAALDSNLQVPRWPTPRPTSPRCLGGDDRGTRGFARRDHRSGGKSRRVARAGPDLRRVERSDGTLGGNLRRPAGRSLLVAGFSQRELRARRLSVALRGGSGGAGVRPQGARRARPRGRPPGCPARRRGSDRGGRATPRTGSVGRRS